MSLKELIIKKKKIKYCKQDRVEPDKKTFLIEKKMEGNK